KHPLPLVGQHLHANVRAGPRDDCTELRSSSDAERISWQYDTDVPALLVNKLEKPPEKGPEEVGMAGLHSWVRADGVSKQFRLRQFMLPNRRQVASLALEQSQLSVSSGGSEPPQTRRVAGPKLVLLYPSLFPGRIADDDVETSTSTQEHLRE